MAKYQMGEEGHYTSEGRFLEAHSVQDLPNDYDPSLTWTPLDSDAAKALDALVAKKQATLTARLNPKQAPTEFKRLPTLKDPKPPPVPEGRAHPNTLSAMAQQAAHQAKGTHLRHADKDVL